MTRDEWKEKAMELDMQPGGMVLSLLADWKKDADAYEARLKWLHKALIAHGVKA